MNPLQRLISQTAIYGLSSVVGRFLNYLLVPLFTYYFSPAEYGVVSEFYADSGFLAVLLVFGLETGYFRFRRESAAGTDDDVYATVTRFLLAANTGFFLLAILFSDVIAGALGHADHPEYVSWMAAVIALDCAAAAGFARLRAEEKAWRFAGIKSVEILVTILLNLFFIVVCRGAYEHDPASALGRLWDPAIGVGYIFIANLAGSAIKWLLLLPSLRSGGRFDAALFRRLLRYSLPLVIIGLAGVTNEMLDRALMKYLLPYDTETNLAQLGIYSACYKLAMLMTLFVQAFRYAAEPFFFAHAGRQDARLLYARTMTGFVVFCMLVFLLVTLFLDVFQYFIGAPFRAGLGVIPVLLLANLFLGIYINLSIWYKLTDRTLAGAGVALAGAAVTIILNLWWVPLMGYAGAAWATLVCYVVMAAASYLLGRRHYPVPYEVARCAGYIGLGLAFYLIQRKLVTSGAAAPLVSGALLLALYFGIAWLREGRRLLRAVHLE